MDNKTSSLVSPLLVLALGVLMICLFNGNFIEWIIEAIGIVMIIVGVYNILAVMARKNEQGSNAPVIVASVIAAALGLWIVIQPLFFEKFMVFVFALALVAVAINDMVFMVQYARPARLPFYFYIVPALMIIAAVVLVVTPMRFINSTVVLITGICLTASGINRLVDVMSTRSAEE